MTRSLPSFTRFLKVIAVATAVLVSLPVIEAFQSNYKLRMNKNFLKNVIDKNFPVILRHIESKIEKNVYLTEINANIDNLALEMAPIDNGQWHEVKSDLFFDQGQIVVEMQELEYRGEGQISDPQSGKKEVIRLSARLDFV